MLFKRLYYYYHHYKMWSYIVGQLKAKPNADLTGLKLAYLGKIGYGGKRYLHYNYCYLCSYDRLIKSGEECAHCPLYKKYGEACSKGDSLYHKVSEYAYYCTSPVERIATAEKIRDCIFPLRSKK